MHRPPKVVDIVFVVDYSSSMRAYLHAVCIIILSIYARGLAHHRNVRFGLIKFRSMNDLWTIVNHGFSENRTQLEEWLYQHEPDGGDQTGHEAVGDAMKDALNMQWSADESVEKLVILLTDEAPNGLFDLLVGADPWIISNDFRERDITLAVIGVGESIAPCEDFYCALAKNTGGMCIPWTCSRRIIRDLITRVVYGEYTFHQAFLHLNEKEIEEKSSFRYSETRTRVDGMINECATIGDIRRVFYGDLKRLP